VVWDVVCVFWIDTRYSRGLMYKFQHDMLVEFILFPLFLLLNWCLGLLVLLIENSTYILKFGAQCRCSVLYWFHINVPPEYILIYPNRSGTTSARSGTVSSGSHIR